MSDREHELEAVAAHTARLIGRRPVAVEPIAAGLGARRFFRLRFAAGEPATLIARLEAEPEPRQARAAGSSPASSPDPALPPAPAWLPEPALEPLRGFLEEAGLPVPRSHGHDPASGLDLLEDLGPHTLLDAPPDRREALYRQACALVPRLQRLAAPPERIAAFGRVYDRALVASKGWKWLHWTLPGLLGRAPSRAEARAASLAFERLADCVLPAPRRLAHRDFKAENLHRVPDRDGDRLVLIDVQGAFLAPPEYDLVCLLYDLQTDLPESLARRLFRETRAELPDPPTAEEADLRFDALATLRLAKDVSHVVHAGLARGDRRRWREIPRGLSLLARAAGRIEPRIPELRALTSVIQALTEAAEATDSPSQGKLA